MFNAMNGQFSDSPVQSSKAPITDKNNRKRIHTTAYGSPGMRNDDEMAMARVNQKRLAKGSLPVSKSNSTRADEELPGFGHGPCINVSTPGGYMHPASATNGTAHEELPGFGYGPRFHPSSIHGPSAPKQT